MPVRWITSCHPGEDWRKLYRLAYGRTDEELGFTQAGGTPDRVTPVDDLWDRLAAARRVDMSLVQHMHRQVHHIRILDRRLGAPSLLEQTRSVITTLTELVSHSLKPSVRQALAAALSDAGALAAWQAQFPPALHGIHFDQPTAGALQLRENPIGGQTDVSSDSGTA